MKKVVIADTIKATAGSDLDIQSTMAYQSIAGSYTDNEIPPYGFLKSQLNLNTPPINIALGQPNPIVIDWITLYAPTLGNFPEIIVETKSAHDFSPFSGGYIKNYDTDDVTLLSITINDPDPEDGTITADAIRVTLK